MAHHVPELSFSWGLSFARRTFCICISTLLIACGGGDTDPVTTATPAAPSGTGDAPNPAPAPQPEPVPVPVPVPEPEPEPEPVPPAREPDPEPPGEYAPPYAALKVQAREYARALWKASETLDPKGRALPSNRACLNTLGVASAYPWIFTGNIGQHIQNLTAARDLGFIPPDEAEHRVARLLTTIATLQQKAGRKGAIGGLLLGTTDSNTAEPNGDVGSIENAWLAVSLALAKQAYPALAGQAQAILGQMRFDTMVNPANQRYFISYNPTTQAHQGGTYGLLGETRLLAYAGIALGQVPRSQYFHIGRVPPGAAGKIDESKYRTYEGVRVYEDTWQYGGLRFMPTNGGSVFETFTVPVLISEAKWGVNNWGRSHPNLAKAHIQYGKDNFDGYWGFSPATIPSTNGYTEFGAPPLSVGGYRPDGNRESTRAGPVVSIYSVLLLIEEQPEATMANMERLLKNFPTLNHPVYGMMDSVAVQDGTVAKCILHANTAWALGAVTNFLTDGKLRGYVDKEWGHALQPLLELEEFYFPANT